MFETNRLKPMVENYDPMKFKRLFEKTKNLRRKLASGIDHRRFGVDQEEVISWFITKFIYAYNKYCQVYNEEVLLGHLVRAMQFMKCRILRAAYQPKFCQVSIEYDSNHVEEEIMNPYEDEVREHYYNTLCEFLKKNLTDNAYMLFQLQINPPLYILAQMKEQGHTNIHKIPDQIICNYFNLGFDFSTTKYLKSLRKEIHNATQLAKEYFKRN